MKNKNGFGRAFAILMVIVVVMVGIPWSIAKKRVIEEVPQQAVLTDNVDCTTEVDPVNLLGSHFTVVGVFQDYICVYTDKEIVKVSNFTRLWEFYSFERDPYHNLTGRSETKATVGQFGVLIMDPRYEEGGYLLLGETFNLVYGSEEDLEFSNMWFEDFVPRILAYTSEIQTEPMLTEFKEFSSQFTPQDACYLAKEYSFAVKIDKKYSFCQYDFPYNGYTHVRVTESYLYSDGGYDLVNVLPNKKDNPLSLKVGDEENKLKLLGCFPVEGYERGIAMDSLETVFIPYFQYKGEVLFGNVSYSLTNYLADPVGVVLEVDGELVYEVIPYRSALEYTYRDGDAYIQDLYVLPEECDPNPSSLWSDFYQKLLWILDRKIVIGIE